VIRDNLTAIVTFVYINSKITIMFLPHEDYTQCDRNTLYLRLSTKHSNASQSVQHGSLWNVVSSQ